MDTDREASQAAVRYQLEQQQGGCFERRALSRLNLVGVIVYIMSITYASYASRLHSLSTLLLPCVTLHAKAKSLATVNVNRRSSMFNQPLPEQCRIQRHRSLFSKETLEHVKQARHSQKTAVSLRCKQRTYRSLRLRPTWPTCRINLPTVYDSTPPKPRPQPKPSRSTRTLVLRLCKHWFQVHGIEDMAPPVPINVDNFGGL